MTEGKPHRLLYFIVAFVLLMFFGFIYAYSLFVGPLEDEFGWNRSETSVVFTLSITTFCIGMIIAGALEERTSPRVVMFITAALIGVGFVAASFTSSLMAIYISYGVLVGTGVGLGTDCVMSTTVKWFPDRQGFVNGAMLMGFGGGTLVLSPLVTTLLDTLSWRVTFVVLGVVFAIVVVVGSFFMKLPSQEYVRPLLEKAQQTHIVSSVDMNASQMIRTSSFWLFMLFLVLVTCGGLALISQAVPAACELLEVNAVSAAEATVIATAAMGSVSGFNALGGLFNGFIWDKAGYRVSLLWVSLAFAAGMLCCAIAEMTGVFPLLVVGFMLLGFMYGGNMSSMSAMCGTFYGAKYYGINYAVATCQMIPAAIIGPQILAFTQMHSGSYLMAFWVFFAIALAALVVSFFVHPPRVEPQGK